MTQPFTYMSPAGVSKDEASFFLFDTSHICRFANITLGLNPSLKIQ